MAKSSPARSELFIGLMSGTSLDGVDAALIDLTVPPGVLRETHFLAYPEDVRAEALALNSAGPNELDRAARLSQRLAELYAGAVNGLLREAGIASGAIAAIGCHGQTVRHRPELGYTIQLGNAARLAELTGIRVVSDFRSRDIAAGGQGAPLVPAFHEAMFRAAGKHRVVVNIGGIANLTNLPTSGSVVGFDTGPGNVLLDLWASAHIGGIDVDGRLAASGRPVPTLLQAMLADPYFERPPPKSTGRDRFHRSWLERMPVADLPVADVQATLAELTALSIASGIVEHCSGATEVYLCGGGVHNLDLAHRIENALPSMRIQSTGALGVDPDWVEAFAFAWLAQRALRGLPGNLPSVTGAAGPRVLGTIYGA